MAALEVPIVVVVTGEGGSGGALGIGVGDVVLMLSHSVYSVISPEGCAAILWHDGSQAPAAAEALKLTADALVRFKIVDEIIPEPPGGAHADHAGALRAVEEAVSRHVQRLSRVSKRKLVENRMEKYARIGQFPARTRSRSRK
jgi:acetyl-CoA carboxylase carboxyl transferase subunit alpha